MKNPYYREPQSDICIFSGLSALKASCHDAKIKTKSRKQEQENLSQKEDILLVNNINKQSQDMRRYVYNEGAAQALQLDRRSLLVPSGQTCAFYAPLEIDEDSTSSELSGEDRLATLKRERRVTKNTIENPDFAALQQRVRSKKLYGAQMIDNDTHDTYETIEDTLLRQELQTQTSQNIGRVHNMQGDQKRQADAMLRQQIEQPLTASGQLHASQMEQTGNDTLMNQSRIKQTTSPKNVLQVSPKATVSKTDTPITTKQNSLPKPEPLYRGERVKQRENKYAKMIQEKKQESQRMESQYRKTPISQQKIEVTKQQTPKRSMGEQISQIAVYKQAPSSNQQETPQFKPGQRYIQHKQAAYHGHEIQIKILEDKAGLCSSDLVRVAFTDISTGLTKERRILYSKYLEYQARAAGKKE